MGTDIIDHVLVPIAGEKDGRRTAEAIESYEIGEITIAFVVEKAGGGPDTLAPAQAEVVASDAFTAFREVIPDVVERVTYGTDVPEAIFDLADELNATAIGFTSHQDGRLMRFLTGNTARRLVTENAIPVISFPNVDT